MKAILKFLSLLAILSTLGCASSSHIITGTVRPPTSEAEVRVFTTPPKKYQEIAILTVESAGWTSQGEVDGAIAKLKKEAARLGANGILLVNRGTASSGVVGSVNPQTGAIWAGQSTYTTMEARAIFVADE